VQGLRSPLSPAREPGSGQRRSAPEPWLCRDAAPPACSRLRRPPFQQQLIRWKSLRKKEFSRTRKRLAREPPKGPGRGGRTSQPDPDAVHSVSLSLAGSSAAGRGQPRAAKPTEVPEPLRVALGEVELCPACAGGRSPRPGAGTRCLAGAMRQGWRAKPSAAGGKGAAPRSSSGFICSLLPN